ncbi:uncharacterized protein LOC131651188 [Vicia villosa]|uniref:uncharacterized protein LOC131651188 n=1 Tax=Vicia villosa TaxID=3911 RepID=UPI00273BB1A3|nr:uncharacterized protein LOC131651188 [Vicia villosa]
MVLEEGEWIRPRDRRREKFIKPWDNVRTRSILHNNPSTTYYFTSFPDNMRAKDLFAVFKDFGEIDEVIIPKRRNKKGKKFGFVRFFDVREADVLATKLDNIFIGGSKLFVNLPRFDRRKEVRGVKQVISSQSRFVRKEEIKKNFVDGRSFAAVTSNKGDHPIEKAAQLEYNMGEDEVWQRFRGAYVGEVRYASLTYNLQEVLDGEGVFGIKITPLGANLCLMEARDDKDVFNDLIEDKDSILEKWLGKIQPWKPEAVDKERDLGFFEFISKPWGSFIMAAAETRNQEKMDVAHFLIRARYLSTIDEKITVKISGSIFTLKIVED